MPRKIIQTHVNCPDCNANLYVEIFEEKDKIARHYYCDFCNYKKYSGDINLISKLILEDYIEGNHLGDISAVFGEYKEEGD
jgi:hypothetical protein